MKIFGRPLHEYVRFSRVFVLLIAAVGITRLALSLAGAPNSTATWFSMTAVARIGVLYCAVRVQSSGFGTYKHLLPIVALINLTAQAIAIGGIVIAIFTGANNIFSSPEYAFGSDGKTWFHAGAHLVLGTTVGTLIPWLTGCLIMLISMKFTKQKRTSAAARA